MVVVYVAEAVSKTAAEKELRMYLPVGTCAKLSSKFWESFLGLSMLDHDSLLSLKASDVLLIFSDSTNSFWLVLFFLAQPE